MAGHDAELYRRMEELEDALTRANGEIRRLKGWKARCDRAALKWGSFAMGMLTLGAVLVGGAHWTSEKILGFFMTMWGGR